MEAGEGSAIAGTSWAKLAATCCLLALAAALALFPAAAGAVVPEFLVQAPEEAESGPGANQLQGPSGVAADPNLPGHLYVADNKNNRISVFSAWGEFLYAFGWGVNASAPAEELQTCTLESGCQAGTEGGGAGQFAHVEAVAVDGEGNLYVAEGLNSGVGVGRGGNSRIQKFGPAGEFLYAAGGDVVAHGPGDSSVDEVQELSVAASEGTFRLSYPTGGGLGRFTKGSNLVTDVVADPSNSVPFHVGEVFSDVEGDAEGYVPAGTTITAVGAGTLELSAPAEFDRPYFHFTTAERTAALPYNASAEEVEAALNPFPAIGGLGGSVAVTGGPGDASGSTPYEITFGGNLGGDDVPQLGIDRSELGAAAIGGTLHCSTSTDAETIEYRWLRNGEEIAGAEADTYTTVAADAGRSVQCQVRAIMPGDHAGSIQAAIPVYVAPPEGATAPPLAPGPLGSGNGNFRVSKEQEALLEVGGAGGTELTCEKDSWPGALSFAYGWYRNGVEIAGATEPTYTVSEADLATPAYFQCKVTAANAGTASTTEFSGASGGSATQGVTNPAPSPMPPPFPEAAMEPPSNVRTVAPGGAAEVCSAADTCKAGVVRNADGWLGAERYSEQLAASPLDGSVFLGEGGNEIAGELAHVQVFEPTGGFREAIELPDGANHALENARQNLRAIAADAAGNLYAGFENAYADDSGTGVHEAEVRKLKPSGPSAEFLTPKFAAPKADMNGLRGFAVDAAGNVYIAGGGYTVPPAGVESEPSNRVLQFDPEGQCLSCGSEGEGGKPGFDRTASSAKGFDNMTGVGAGSGCAAEDVYVLHTGSLGNRFKIFGPPPDTAVCPPPEAPPAVASQYAVSVNSSEAQLRAQINPRFWNDTTYFVEYGTSPCTEGGCTQAPAAPGRLLSTKTTKAKLTSPTISISGLQPGSVYHYRFVAQSSGGGPVRGVGGTPGEDGAEGAFRTPALGGGGEACPNQAFRGASGAYLPDCRAYELVSPLDKADGDIVNLNEELYILPAVLNQSSAAGGKLAYGSYRAFGDAKAAPYTAQYIASRGAGEWSSHYILGPREELNVKAARSAESELKALSPDLCQGWFRSVAEPPLAAKAVAGQANLYRRSDEECGEEAYEALSTVEPISGELGSTELQGTSADGSKAIYVTLAKLSADAPDIGGSFGGFSLYFQEEGEGPPRYVCRGTDGLAMAISCSAGGPLVDWVARGRSASLHNAISADGERVFFSAPATGTRAGKIYLREHPGEPESDHQLGTAAGTGDVIGPATGTGKLTKFVKIVTGVSETPPGGFVAGQAITGEGVKAGTTIESVDYEAHTLRLSKSAAENGTAVELSGAASEIVPNAVAESGEFRIGQEISAANGAIPDGTTIEAVEGPDGEGHYTLGLSAQASASGAGVGLSATSPCTKPERACTVAVSKEAEGIEGSESSQYWWAAADGSRALFTTGGTLYEFEVDTETTRAIAAGVVGVMGASEDAARVYFASTLDLGTGPNPVGDSPQAGKPNLYLAEGGKAAAFVASLAVGTDTAETSYYAAISAAPHRRTARVSPDGLHAAFTSSGRLTHYDNTDAKSGAQDLEAFLYDATGGGELLCVSCNPSGARPVGGVLPKGSVPAAASIPVWFKALYPGRMLAPDGSRLYFEAADALVPRDANGTTDVYQWEEPGTGGCDEKAADFSAQNGGCVSLISSGQSSGEAHILDASQSGGDVFFTTAASLVGWDYGLIDVYDARVNGGLPGPPAPPGECEGEACQNPAAAPEASSPASLQYQGPGNLKEALAPFARCNRSARRAKRLSMQAKRLRGAARRAKSPAARRKRLLAARHSARAARKRSRGARRCRARVRKQKRGGR